MSFMTLSLFINHYNAITQGFFHPFEDYDQIVDGSTNYAQFLPADSVMNQSIEDEIRKNFEEVSIACLLIPNDSTITSFRGSYIMGVPHDQIEILWDKIG